MVVNANREEVESLRDNVKLWLESKQLYEFALRVTFASERILREVYAAPIDKIAAILSEAGL